MNEGSSVASVGSHRGGGSISLLALDGQLQRVLVVPRRGSTEFRRRIHIPQ